MDPQSALIKSPVDDSMSTMVATAVPEPVTLGHDMTSLDNDVIELALLLPRWQAMALGSVAKQRGMTAAQMLRRLIGAAVGQQPPFPQS